MPRAQAQAQAGQVDLQVGAAPLGDIELNAVFNELADAVLVADSSGILRLANPAACALFGRDRDELLAMPLVELMPERFRQAHTDAFTRFMSTGVRQVARAHPIPVLALRADGTEAQVDLVLGAFTGAGGMMAVATLRDATEARAELTAQLEAAQRSQAFLLRATEVLAHASGYAQTLEELATVAVPTLADLCLIDVLANDGQLVRRAARHADPSRQPLADELRRHYPPQVTGTHPSVAVLTAGTSQWSPEMSDEFLRATTRDEHHFELVKALDFTSYISVPLIADDDVLGVVTLVSAGSGRRFGPLDLALAENLAGRVALVVAKARRYDTEQKVSSTLQASLLPNDLPSIPGVDVAVRYLPGTRDLDVGGDFFDVLPDGDCVTFVVGDVAGHDTTAAAVMGQLRTACRAFATQTSGPAELLALLQTNWYQLGFDRIATAVVARLDPATGALRVASAGHLAPLIIDGASTRFLPVEPAPPLGAPAVGVTEWQGVLPAGAALLCFTDGLVEDRHQDIDAGTARLLNAAQQPAPVDAERLCDRVVAEMTGDERADDVAILVVTHR